MSKFAANGHTLSDTSLITSLIVIAAIGTLSALGGNISQLLQTPAHVDFMPYMAPTANVSNVGNVSGTSTSTAAQASASAAQVQASLNISDYPTQMANSVLTTGVNGTTTKLSQQLNALASTMLANGEISPEESNRLSALANQGLRMAGLEATLETASKSADSNQAFLNTTIKFDGKSYLVKDAATLIGFSTPNSPDNDVIANGNYMLSTDTAQPETMSFLKLYDSAMNDPDLNVHPQSKAIVQKLSAQISYLSDVGSNMVFGAFNDDVSLSTLRQQTVSSGTAFDSYSIYKKGSKK